MKLKEKVSIVTGGGSGIGREIALGFAREGADVVVAARKMERLKETVNQIEKLGRKGLAFSVDIRKKQEVDQLVKHVMEGFGKIDILVNNSAVYYNVPFLEISEEQWCEIVDINLNGVFRVTQAVAREMVKRKSGSIINITSAQAFMGIALMADYTATKGGILSLTRALAAELSPLGITVTGIAPGLTTTDNVTAALPKNFQDDFARSLAAGRLASPDEYVDLAVLLASEGGSYLTGTTIQADGGMTNVMASIKSGFDKE